MKIIESKDGERLAEVILSGQKVDKTTFYSDPNSSFQFGFVAHKKGYQEEAHFHKKIEKKIFDVSQVLFVQKGTVVVDFYNKDSSKLTEVILNKGDAINIITGIHRIRVLDDCQCLTVKQGPFISDELDKVEVSFINK
tara:strand:- start:510 stop:923 length:414 start_codon:yes stop_codon:yes gene_type:complete